MKAILFHIALVLNVISFAQGPSFKFDFVIFGDDTLAFSNPLDIGTKYESQLDDLEIHFNNTGNRQLQITSIHGNWSSNSDKPSGIYLPGESGSIKCSIAPRPGPISGAKLCFHTNDLDNKSIEVKVKGRILPNIQAEKCNHQKDTSFQYSSLSGTFSGYRDYQFFDSINYPKRIKQLKESYTLSFEADKNSVKVTYFMGWFDPNDTIPTTLSDGRFKQITEEYTTYQHYRLDSCYLTIECRNLHTWKMPAPGPAGIDKVLIFHAINEDELVFIDPNWKKSKYKGTSGYELAQLSIKSIQMTKNKL